MSTDTKNIIKIGGIILFFVFVLIFGFFRSRDLLFGVEIKDVKVNGQALESGATVPDIMRLTGNARNAASLTINGRAISIDREGNFDETILALSGYNIMTLEAQDKFGNTDKKDYQLVRH